MDSGVDLDRGLPAMYQQDHSALDSHKSNFFQDPTESLSAFTQSPDDAPGPLDRISVGPTFDPEEPGLPSGEEVEALGQAMLHLSVSQGSSHSLKLDESRFDGLSLGIKSLDRQDSGEQDDQPQADLFPQAAMTSSRATPPAEGLLKPEKLPLPGPSKQKAELRWGGRSGTGRREGAGGERPIRRSGPIKKPVLRDMKEEREQREEREKRHERGERGDRPKKEPLSKAPSAAAAVSDGSRAPEAKKEAAQAEEPPASHLRARDSQPSSSVPTSSSQEEKAEKLPIAEKHPEPKLPSRKDSNLPPRGYRREERERERERDKDMDKDRDKEWPGDANFKGRGRGEYYSRGRSYRGTYSGRGRGSRGRSRPEYPYREPRSRSDLPSAGGAAAFRNREESETRSESSDFEVIPKRRRRRGSDTDSESEGGRESASDTGPSDREPSAKPSRPLRRELPGEPRPGPHKPGFGPPHSSDKAGPRCDDEGRPKPGFLPKGEPSRRGRGGLYSRRGGTRERGAPRSAPLRRPPPRDLSSQWPSKPMETFRPEDADSTHRYDNPPSDRRPPKPDGKKYSEASAPPGSRERPRRSRPARPPRQDKPPRFRRLKEREAAVLAGGESSPAPAVPPLPAPAAQPTSSSVPAPTSISPTLSRAPGTPLSVPVDVPAAIPVPDLSSSAEPTLPDTSSPPVIAVGTKSPDLSNQNSSDQANEEWETASESSDFNERRERDERNRALEAASEAAAVPVTSPLQGPLTPSKSPPDAGTSKRDAGASTKRSFSNQRPAERPNRRANAAAKQGRSYTGGKGERRGGAKAGRKG